MARLWFLVLLLVLLTPSPAAAVSEYEGEVVRVIDGDTIEVLHNQQPERIRLSGIDSPEKGQAYGKRARQAASELVFGKKVTIQTHGKDKCGASLPICSCRMIPTSITRRSKMVSAGGIGSMRRGIGSESRLRRVLHDSISPEQRH